MSNQTDTAIHPYLTFNGNCREAMTFYKESLDAGLEIMDFGSAPMEVPEEAKNNVLHAILTRDGITLMASDCRPGQPVKAGDNVSLSVNCTSRAQADTFFNRLGAGGTVTMPLEDTFWGAYFGMLTDQFGIHWMFNYDEPRP